MEILRAFIHINRISRPSAIRINPLPFPFIFRLRDHDSFRSQCPGIFHSGYINALCFTANSAIRPAWPQKIKFPFMLKSGRMYPPIPFRIGHDRSFHTKLPLHWIRRVIFNHINLVIIRIPVISRKIDIPFAIDISDFRIPEMIRVWRIFGYPNFLTGGAGHVSNVGSYP